MDTFENWLPLLLTKEELKALQKRFRIIQLLKTKLTYREIAQKMSISTTTVVRLNQRLKIRRKPPKSTPKTYSKQPTNVASLEYKKSKLPWKFG